MLDYYFVLGTICFLFGLISTLFHEYIAKNIYLSHRNVLVPSKKTGKKYAIAQTAKEFYGEKAGGKMVFYLMGLLPLVVGLIVMVVSLMKS